MFDHVTLRVSDLETARDFYEAGLAILGFGDPHRGDRFFEWRDLSVASAREDLPVTRHVHIGLVARSREHVDTFWETLTERGFRDDGPPGAREKYRPDYYGAFLLDPDANSIEAVHRDDPRTDGGCIDHVWIRVRDVAASTRFYGTIAPVLGLRPTAEEATYAYFVGRARGLALTAPNESWSALRPPSENAHLAFPAPDRTAVDELHRVALAAGYRDNGPPGERPCHTGYYGAFVLDPDGNNVEAVFRDLARPVATPAQAG